MYTIELGIPETSRLQAAELYWDAFGRKLGPALGPRARGVRLVSPRARELYEREGFVVTKVERTPYLRKLMGFGSSAEMVAPIDP